MTDDIVKYLRLSATRFNRHYEAADEIERLRKELAAYKAAVLMLKGHTDECLSDFGDEPCTCGYEKKMKQYETEMGDD